ncbi:hypothetical protein BBJ28_00014974 [Nothophytophthora sp. Chile5]|nr:hypothetical protein BBJ28_00014974 [Nothophytophthora sp. Chile5]
MYIAGEICRQSVVFFPLSSGKTSVTTKHLKKEHDVSSERKDSTYEKKRARDVEIDRLRNSQMYRDDPVRIYVPMETIRIVNNNLPYKPGEYEESVSICELVVKIEMQTILNHNTVSHCIVEFYSSTKIEIEGFLKCVDATRCMCIAKSDLDACIPSTTRVGLDPDEEDYSDTINGFLSENRNDDDGDDEE